MAQDFVLDWTEFKELFPGKLPVEDTGNQEFIIGTLLVDSKEQKETLERDFYWQSTYNLESDTVTDNYVSFDNRFWFKVQIKEFKLDCGCTMNTMCLKHIRKLYIPKDTTPMSIVID